MTLVIEGACLEQQRLKTGLSLLFAAGDRPSVQVIDDVLAAGDSGLPGAMVCHRPPESEGWLEILASGLTFELHGLAPASSTPVTPAARGFGFTAETAQPSLQGLEAVALVAGPHIAGGAAMLPIVRTITGLAASLSLVLPVRAICWEPADSWMEPRYFTRLIVAWLAGGPFPALGLTSVMPDAEGFFTSTGLGFFSGQEIRVMPRGGEPPAQTAKLAIRMIDNIVRGGRIEQRIELDSPDGETIIAEPSGDGRTVTVWRGR